MGTVGQPQQGPEQSGLAGAVRADDGDGRPGRSLQDESGEPGEIRVERVRFGRLGTGLHGPGHRWRSGRIVALVGRFRPHSPRRELGGHSAIGALGSRGVLGTLGTVVVLWDLLVLVALAVPAALARLADLTVRCRSPVQRPRSAISTTMAMARSRRETEVAAAGSSWRRR